MKIKRAIICLLLFMGLYSSVSFSSNIYFEQYGSSYAEGVTPESACLAFPGYIAYLPNYGTPKCQANTSAGMRYLTIGTKNASCPTGYVDDGSGQCILAPSYSCSNIPAIVANVDKSSGTIPQDLCLPAGANTNHYCSYTTNIIPLTSNNSMSVLYAPPSNGSIVCSTPSVTNNLIYMPFVPDPVTKPMTEQDTRIVKSDDNYSPPNTVCVANGNGTDTCITISDTTTTKIDGQGTITSSDGTTFTTKNFNGDTTIVDEKKTVTTDGAGTTTDKTVTTVTSTPSSSSSSTYSDSTKTTTSSTTAGNSSQIVTSTTTTTYPDGTSTTTSTTNTPAPVPDAKNPGKCGAPNQPNCAVVVDGFGDSALLTSPSDVINNSNVFGAIDSVTGSFATLTSDNQMIPVPEFNIIDFHEGGTCDVHAFQVNYHSTPFAPLDKFCQFYDADVRPIFYWFIWGLTIVGLFFVYSNVVRKS